MEGPEEFVRRELDRISSGAVPVVTASGVPTPSRPVTERELFETKRPNGHAEIVTVFGFVTVQGAVQIERIGVPSVACCGESDRTGVRTPKSDWSRRTNGFAANWPNVNGS
jgi:hypothetical protein